MMFFNISIIYFSFDYFKKLLFLFCFIFPFSFTQFLFAQNFSKKKTEVPHTSSTKDSIINKVHFPKFPKGLSISFDFGYAPITWGISNPVAGAHLVVKNFQESFLNEASRNGPQSLQGFSTSFNIEYRGIPYLEFVFIRVAPSFEYTPSASYLIRANLENLLDRFDITSLVGSYQVIVTLLNSTLIPLLELFDIKNVTLPESLLIEIGIDYSQMYQVSIPILIGIEIFRSSKVQFYTGIGLNYTYATITTQEVGIREIQNGLLGFDLSNIPVSNTFTMNILGLSMVFGAKIFIKKNIFIFSEIEFKYARGTSSIKKPKPIDGESNLQGAIDEFNRLASDLDAQLTDNVFEFIKDVAVGVGKDYIQDYLIILLENIVSGPFTPNTNKYDRTFANLSSIKYHIGVGYQF